MGRDFMRLLEAKWKEEKHVCVGLDKCSATHMCAIVDATCSRVAAYKPNLAFYLAYLEAGITVLGQIISHIHRVAPDMPIILDCKDADVKSTNDEYVRMIEKLCPDAITTNPYLGQEALLPFLERNDMGVIVLCRTSNPGAKEFQDLQVSPSLWTPQLQRTFGNRMGMPLYQYVAHQVTTEWNGAGNCGVVVGATYPGELVEVRRIVGDDMPILIPGVGAQGGDLEASVRAAKCCFLINLSRSVMNASDPRAEVLRCHEQIVQVLSSGG